MLKLEQKESGRWRRTITIVLVVIAIVSAGLYVGALYTAPICAPVLFTKPIEVTNLPAPRDADDRIVLPRIGVNIAYGQGNDSLAKGAEWRSSSNGNPEEGGNFVIAAYRFRVQVTPTATVDASPFYNLDKLRNGDKVVVDYKGKRYAYSVFRSLTVKPSEIEIEARTNDPTLSLLSIDDGSDEYFVVQAKRLGQLAIQ